MSDKIIKALTPWVLSFGALISSVLALISFGYDTFAAKETIEQIIYRIEKRLDRIELKIDTIRERD